ncbi:MAG TPA: biotin--[acetyl-CoA-carboxylase] ligase [Bryobacteraceae bacterium]|jgi:BirA family biotin operon repressor/biotin-[acetyl-CoA-carboxylase] ligase|nr:biotin--[acetyl-CoA-carboxylase] ligase [Bryobacteraceae bacterium]
MPLDIEVIRQSRPDNELHYFRSVGSTMTIAARLAAAGAPHGTVVVADEQTAGVGRLGRTWQSVADAGLYSSILLRLRIDASHFPIVTLVLGLATADAIQKSTDLVCDLRWPNDVLIRERKAAGILAQLHDGCVVAGIGINVNQTSFPDDLRTPATSLLIESNGKPQSREALAMQLFESLDAFCGVLEADGPPSILRAFSAASSYTLHRRVIIEDNGREGVTAGLDEQGFLMVRFENGAMERVAAGGVRPVR